MTPAESILWEAIRGRQLGIPFQRQRIVRGYVPDFLAAQAKLVIEVDGGYHQDPDQKKQDEIREDVLKRCGYMVLRFTNEQVEDDLPTVLRLIRLALEEQGIQPRPQPRNKPRKYVPIGLIIKRMLAKGHTYHDAINYAYRVAGKPSPCNHRQEDD